MTIVNERTPLQCPSCGDSFLHHGEVHVYARPQEDGPGHRVVIWENGDVEKMPAAGGFAGRRNDLRIRFTCETCVAVSWLFIVQHKGHTMLRWETEETGQPSPPMAS